MGCGADTEANTLLTSLIAGKDFEIPDVDLDGPEFEIPPESNTGIYAPITRLTNNDLTTGAIDGSGTFDALMRGFKAHLKEEYEKGRITGGDYTKAYIELTQAAMGNATQYLLGRDQAYWAAVTAQAAARLAQIQVVTSRVQLATAKVQLVSVQIEASNQEANYGLTKMKISTESMSYCTGKFQLEQLLPEQKNMLLAQVIGQGKQNDTLAYTLANILPTQKLLGQEQAESARAQTMDTRSDGTTPINGVLGKQKSLYTQQITSYQRDSEVKTAKLFTDAWITMKTMDEGLLPPTNFQNTSLDAILGDLKTNNNIG